MSSDLPPGMGGFFPGMLGDLLRLLRSDAPFPFELTEQLAVSIAAEGEPRPVDPLERIRLEGLVRIADLQVADVTGMATGPAGRETAIVTLDRVEWVRTNLRTWRSSFEQLAIELRPKPGDIPVPTDSDDDESEQGFAALLGQWSGAIAPAMIAMQFGSIVGHLSTRALGQYELILPRSDDSALTVVPENLASFAADWSLPPDDVALYLTVLDVAMQAVLTRPHVRERLWQLILEHARGFHPNPQALEQALGDASLSDGPGLPEISRLLGSPTALGELADTPELRKVRNELSSLAAAIGGYAQWVTKSVAERSIGSTAPIAEALRRRRVERGDEERAADGLLGLSLDQQTLDRGEAFVRGLLSRDAERELSTLFVVEKNLPTPAEIDAPGLWIERINLPSEKS